ncbi:tyrosine-type recombinase/integrase [Neptuniibacter sp. QD29_5]|uniref:tyrosine-type recombinase/integrase n=1 Tax=Neptuniibacter sp. QD29_5 TaxID=3398207 RepID=UPI0039F47F31
MAKVVERHHVNDDIVLYKQDNSKRWYARFKVEGAWYVKATKAKEIKQAIVKAIQLQTEFMIMLSNNIPVHKSRKVKKYTFNVVSKLAIERMESALVDGTGREVYITYINALKKYHLPYFGEMSVKDIDAAILLEFDDWRANQLGRVPSKSTVQDHNSAMQRVLDEAVIQRIITQSEMPILKNTGKTGTDLRAAFTREEYDYLVKATLKWVDQKGLKEQSKKIRKLLHFYIQVATLTGMRPGKEVEHITWSDVHKRTINGKEYTTITVRKGKTTRFTGTREIVCNEEVLPVLEALKDFQTNTADTDTLFYIDAAHSSDVFSKNFTKLLRKEKMVTNERGKRTLYSCRHTFITWKLQEGVDINVIAAQCGNSAEVIQTNYNHVVPTMFAHELSGDKAREQKRLEELSKELTSTVGMTVDPNVKIKID